MTLAANVLNAVGGAPRGRHAAGSCPPTRPFWRTANHAFEVPLLKFSKEALEVFLQIERPGEHDGLPEDDEFETIGQFYEAIEEALRRLSAELGEAALFCGDPARQVTDELYYGGSGRIITVTDLASALAALEEIVEQGEGMQHQEVWDGDRDMFHPEREEVAHYFRFNELVARAPLPAGRHAAIRPDRRGLRRRLGRRPRHAPKPSHERLPGRAARRGALDEFNHTYSSCLHLLDGFNGSPRLLAVATGLMYGLKEEAIRLMELPSGDGTTTVGPSFEYVPPGERHLSGSTEPKIVVIRTGHTWSTATSRSRGRRSSSRS